MKVYLVIKHDRYDNWGTNMEVYYSILNAYFTKESAMKFMEGYAEFDGGFDEWGDKEDSKFAYIKASRREYPNDDIVDYTELYIKEIDVKEF